MAPDPREEMIRFCRMAWQRGYMTATDGNLSSRLGPERILITPAGRSKALVEAADLVEVDLSGRVLAGGRPSAELAMHLAVYRARPETQAVAHAHPPYASALSAAGVELDLASLPEALVGLDAVPTVPYATPGGDELARAVEPFMAGHDALLLAHHGTLTLGPDMESAWARTEKLENAAQVLWAARALGGARPLPLGEQARLRAMGGHAGPGRPARESLSPLKDRIELVHLAITEEYRVEKRWRDGRGEAHLIVDGRDLKRVCLLTLEPGQGFRGGHLHWHKHEGFYVAGGRAQGELVCATSGERLNLELALGDRLWIPPGVAHRFFALTPLTFVEFTDRAYDPDDDTPFDFDR